MAAALMTGQLTIEVKEAKDLYNVNFLTKMDPFVTLSVGFSEEKFRSRPAKDGHKNPKWDQSFIFNLTGKEDAIHIQVWSKGVTDTQIGRLDMLLPQLNFGVPAWYNIVDRNNFNKVNGQILLVFHFNGKGARTSIMGTPVVNAIVAPSPAVATVAAVPATTSSDFVEVTKSKSAAPLPTPVPSPSPPPAASAPTYVSAYPSLEGQPPAYAMAVSPPPYEAAMSGPHPPGGPSVSPTPIVAAIASAPSVVGSGSGIPASNQYPGNNGYATYSTPIRPVMAVAPGGHHAGYIQSSSTSPAAYPGNVPATYAQMVATPSGGYVASPAVMYSAGYNGYAAQPQVLAVTMPVHYIAPGPPTASSTLPYQVATPTQVQFPSSAASSSARPGAPYATTTYGVQYPSNHTRSSSVAGVNIITAAAPNNTYASQPAPAFSTYPGQR